MSAEPLTREERERIARHYGRGYEDVHGIRLDVERLLATIKAEDLRAMGYVVDVAWILGEHEMLEGEANYGGKAERFAADDVRDWGGLLNIDSEGVIYADAKTGHRTKRPIGKKTRRRCLCHGRITHTGLADDVAMMDGCEWCVRKWVADPDYLPPGFVA